MSEKNISIDTADIPKNGKSRNVQLSANSTLFWRIFMPVSGTVFWIAMNIAFWLLAKGEINLPFLSDLASRLLVLACLFAWIAYAWFRLMRFHRIEVNEHALIVTNYWHTVQYPWEAVQSINRRQSFMTDLVEVELVIVGRFGKVLQFLPSKDFAGWAEINTDKINQN